MECSHCGSQNVKTFVMAHASHDVGVGSWHPAVRFFLLGSLGLLARHGRNSVAGITAPPERPFPWAAALLLPAPLDDGVARKQLPEEGAWLRRDADRPGRQRRPARGGRRGRGLGRRQVCEGQKEVPGAPGQVESLVDLNAVRHSLRSQRAMEIGPA